jgi:short-subunit dehydrogenase
VPVDLTGRPIAITGASSGIGRATALACARAGMPVAVGARRADRLQTLVEEIRQAGGRAVAVAMDVTSEEECRALVDAAFDEFGSIYAVIANAGYGSESPVLETPALALREIFETNVFGSLNAIRPAVERMRSNTGVPRGHVLLSSSCVARLALPNLGVYSATKAAQAHIGSSLRVELRNEHIRVSTVHPVGVRTEFFEQARHVTVPASRRHRPPRAFTQDADVVAHHIVRCLRRPRPEVWTGSRGMVTRLTAAAVTAWPGLGDRIGRSTLRP